MVDPEKIQKPDIASVMEESQTLSRSESVHSEDSFKSTSSQLPTESNSTAPSTPPKRLGPTRIPLAAPLPISKPKVAPALAPQQETMYAHLLSTVSQWTSTPESTSKGATTAPLTEDERMWLTRECLLRYLRATKWKMSDAIKRLQSTLSWRREYGADAFTAEYISPENETGKQVVQGYDNEARPCLYLNPARQNTKMSDRQIHHLSFMLDRTLDMLPPGQETCCLLINLKGAHSANVPTVSQAKAVLNILQDHNPERLGRALISDLPWYVSAFFKLISPFIDTVTRDKMKFNPDLRSFVPAGQLWNAYGGDLDFEYDHNAYWPALDAECKRRRDAYKDRWVRAGAKVGEYEEYLRGGEGAKSLSQLLGRGAI